VIRDYGSNMAPLSVYNGDEDELYGVILTVHRSTKWYARTRLFAIGLLHALPAVVNSGRVTSSQTHKTMQWNMPISTFYEKR
jgi:hypothetical protein